MKTTKKRIGVRHGDLALFPVTNLPEGLKKASTKVIMTGSGGHDHIAVNCDIYFKQVNQFVFGYLVAGKGAKLQHLEHGDREIDGVKECDLHTGVYELRKQFEDTNEGMVPVID